MGERRPTEEDVARLGLEVGRVEAWLRDTLRGLQGTMRVETISGGQSNPTFFLHFDNRTLVLRKQPPGPLLPSAHAVDREYRVMKALAKTPVPVPEMLAFCDDRSVTGSLFYVMERVEGRVFHDNALPGLSPEERRACYDSMADTLAELHMVDPEAVGLGDFGKPGNYYARQFRRWSRQYEEARTRDLPDVERLLEWLPANMPEDDGMSGLCHGDYRLGNLMFHPDRPEVVAVLDWELSTLGHPLADVAYTLMFWRMTPQEYGGVAGLDLDALGIPGEQAYVSRYFARRGLPNTLTVFHRVFALFRFAMILEGIAGRVKQGNAAAANAAEIAGLAETFARRAVEMIEHG